MGNTKLYQTYKELVSFRSHISEDLIKTVTKIVNGESGKGSRELVESYIGDIEALDGYISDVTANM